ncbi:MAG TPA: CmcI family methyltransferase [Polyangia bacterium]|nr:CmcI family methyltransferase [Polyangia bacterium]
MNEILPARHQLVRRALKHVSALPDDATPSLEDVARALDVSPKLLASLPELRFLFQPPGIERSLDLTLRDWLTYHYHFVHQGFRYGHPELQQTWRGYQLLKNPLDCWVYQEIIARTKPDVVLELGVAFGGSAVFFADVLSLIGHGEVIGVDVSLERARGVEHPRVTFLEGSSVDAAMVADVHRRCAGKRVMVFLDSDHQATHVLRELESYCDLVASGMYMIVEDGLADVMRWMPVPLDGPLVACRQFVAAHPEFSIDLAVGEKYLLTQSPYGFLVKR